MLFFDPLSANPTEWPNTLKQFATSNLLTDCLSAFDHFVGMALKGLINLIARINTFSSNTESLLSHLKF